MAWHDYLITCKGKSTNGWIDPEQETFDIPCSLDVKVGDTLEANNIKYKAISVTNVGNRDENLLVQGEKIDGKSTKGGTSSKIREAKPESSIDD